MEKVILVNRQDEVLGLMEKMEAHRTGSLHRAFSIFIFNDKKELLLQQGALEKYHSGGLWTNSCCSHPRQGETVIEAGNRRMIEELGCDTELKREFSFIYRAELDQGLTEHELDHVLIGNYNELPEFNKEEVMAVKYVPLHELENDIMLKPDEYTEWFKIIFQKVKNLIA